MKFQTGNNEIKVLLILIISLIGLAGCQSKEKVEVKKEYRVAEYIEMETQQAKEGRKFSGIAETESESKLSFKVDGTMIYRKDVGDRIGKGQVIAKLDSEPYQLQVDEAIASIKAREATELNAYSLYDKMRNLYVQGNSAKTDLESARAQYESARAMTQLTKKQIESAKLKLSYTNLIAPSSGIIAETFAEINENVKSGDEIALLLSGNVNKVKVDIPDTIIYKVKKGIKADIIFDTMPDKIFEGFVSEISEATGEDTTTYPVTIKLTNPDKDIKSGMTADVSFKLSSKQKTGIKQRFVVPSISILKDDSSNYVYLIEKTENGLAKVKKQKIVIGEIVGNGFEVKYGLKKGDKVLKAGVSKVIDGDIVRIEK